MDTTKSAVNFTNDGRHSDSKGKRAFDCPHAEGSRTAMISLHGFWHGVTESDCPFSADSNEANIGLQAVWVRCGWRCADLGIPMASGLPVNRGDAHRCTPSSRIRSALGLR